jgi:phosphotriesterase-related protein
MVLSEENPVKCDFLNDAARINNITKLIDDGFLKQILISQDVCLKFQVRSFAGGGYHHILDDVVPLMRLKGMKEQDIWTIIVDNPARVFQFV